MLNDDFRHLGAHDNLFKIPSNQRNNVLLAVIQWYSVSVVLTVQASSPCPLYSMDVLR